AVTALASGSTLTVVSVYRPPPMMYTGEPAVLVAPEARADRDRAGKLLDVAREYLHDYSGELRFLTAEGNPAGVLAEFSARAQTLVVGARGRSEERRVGKEGCSRPQALHVSKANLR